METICDQTLKVIVPAQQDSTEVFNKPQKCRPLLSYDIDTIVGDLNQIEVNPIIVIDCLSWL